MPATLTAPPPRSSNRGSIGEWRRRGKISLIFVEAVRFFFVRRQTMTNSTINWTNTMKTNVRLWLFAGSLLLGAGAPVTAWAQAAKDAPLFPDKKLEAAARRQVFEKRDNDKPLVEADVLNLSTIDGKGMGITDLTGLEKCRSLASLDLAKNQIRKIDALTNLANIQMLILSDNQIEEVSALAGVKALQYLELSNNKVKSIAALAAVTNLA